MKFIFADGAAGLAGLLIFFIFFLGVVFWVFRPGSKSKYQQDAQIPLKEYDND